MASNVIIEAYSQAGDEKRMLASLERMRKRLLVPDVVTYTSILSFYGRRLDLKNAQKYWDDMLQAGVKADQRSIMCFLLTHCRTGNTAKAEEAFLPLVKGSSTSHRHIHLKDWTMKHRRTVLFSIYDYLLTGWVTERRLDKVQQLDHIVRETFTVRELQERQTVTQSFFSGVCAMYTQHGMYDEVVACWQYVTETLAVPPTGRLYLSLLQVYVMSPTPQPTLFEETWQAMVHHPGPALLFTPIMYANRVKGLMRYSPSIQATFDELDALLARLALEQASWLKEPGERGFDVILCFMNHALMTHIKRSLKDKQIKLASLCQTLTPCLTKIEAWGDLYASGTSLHYWSSLIELFSVLRLFDKVHVLLDRLPASIKLDMTFVGGLLTHFLRQGNMTAMKILWNTTYDMTGCYGDDHALKRLPANVTHQNAAYMVLGYVKCGDLDKALEWCLAILNGCPSLNHRTATLLLNTMNDHAQAKTKQDLFVAHGPCQLPDDVPSVPDTYARLLQPPYALVPDTAMYNALLRHHGVLRRDYAAFHACVAAMPRLSPPLQPNRITGQLIHYVKAKETAAMMRGRFNDFA